MSSQRKKRSRGAGCKNSVRKRHMFFHFMNLMSQYLLTINFLNASAAGSAYKKTKEECPWIFPTEQHCRQWSSMLAEANTHDAVTMVLSSHLPMMKWWTCLFPALTNPPEMFAFILSIPSQRIENVQSINTSWSITVRLQSQCLRHARFRGKVIDLAKVAVERGCFWHSLLPSILCRNLLRKHSFHANHLVNQDHFHTSPFHVPMATLYPRILGWRLSSTVSWPAWTVSAPIERYWPCQETSWLRLAGH